MVQALVDSRATKIFNDRARLILLMANGLESGCKEASFYRYIYNYKFYDLKLGGSFPTDSNGDGLLANPSSLRL